MQDLHTLSFEYQIKQSRKCKAFSKQNRILYSTLENVIAQLKKNESSETIILKIESILKENKPL